LTIRVGLNSGPTTAGVLRGEKARFQLFGDVRCLFRQHLNTRSTCDFAQSSFLELKLFSLFLPVLLK
jgi:hypothetical protein